jgi:predicted transcriptional regulator
MWGLRSTENQEILTAIKKKDRNSIVPWMFEPALDQVITLAVINGFCTRDIRGSNLVIEITEKGHGFLTKLEELGLFSDDIERVKEISIIPQTIIAEVNKKWELF